MTESDTHFTYYESPIGLLKIGGTGNYISELSFVDFKNQIVHGEPGVSDVMHLCTEQLIEFFCGNRKQFSIPVYQQGTAFQQKVWAALLEIPYGSTFSYQHLANKIGDPKSVRAVAQTNARNKIAILVPCHRVIGSNKSLTGYSGGLWRKKTLLEMEFNKVHGVQTLF